jgi:hypothetical protein
MSYSYCDTMSGETAARAATQAMLLARRTRTLYVREEDQAVWDKAKEVIGDSLSSYLTTHLRSVVASHEAAARGKERIVLTFPDEGILRTKAFYGRWLIPPDKPFEKWEWNSFRNDYDRSEPPTLFAVAQTAKNRIAVFRFGDRKDDGTFTWGNLWSFDSFEEANLDSHIPSDLIASAMKVMGVQVEELDI